ncbi:MAG TPA: TlpA disulfide reductase family protein [Mucilaginibacter sp.]|nr:TlpA disulfide reductase family protein [Mucilaginibacter sp.]
MNWKKLPYDKMLSALMILFIIAYLSSARVKSWIIMAFLLVGFYKPHVPAAKSGETLPPGPALHVQDITGNLTDLSQLKGKVVFVNFWAVWCPPCLAELPSVDKLYRKLKDDPNIVFITVDVDNNLPRSSAMLQHRGYLLPVYGPSKYAGDFWPDMIPTTFVINKKGEIAFKELNRAKYDDEKFVRFMTDLSKE